MRYRVAFIALVMILACAALGVTYLLDSLLPLALAAATGIVFYLLGRQHTLARRKLTAERRAKNYRERNYERYVEWRSSRD